MALFPSRNSSSLVALLLLALTTVAPAQEWDLLISNARIVDGTGAPAYTGSVAVKAGRIVAMGDLKGPATEHIDARGHVVAPGFIDVHTHSEKIASLPLAENFLRMGVTTIVTGNCGMSHTDIRSFFSALEKADLTLHVATLIGHGSVRKEVMGGSFLRAPTPEQLEKMKAAVEEAMHEGALGLSTGLIYLPGSFAKADEIIALARVAAAHDGIYASHIRAETVRIFGALEEFIHVAREAKIRAQVSHIKLTGPTAWGKSAEVFALLDKARADGLSITHDQYVYTASSTGLSQLIPDKAREGTREDFIERLQDPGKKAAIKEEMRQMRTRIGRPDYAYAVIAKYDADPLLNGRTIPQAAKLRRGSDSLEDQIELILEIERRGGGNGVFHGMNEDDLTMFLKHPLTMFASDGNPKKPGMDMPHPRSYGNNARVLSRYVRELKVITLEEAVRRMTSLPAQTFRLKDRGVIAPGAWADLVVFDPEAVRDVATFESPHHFSEGFSQVIVDGVSVIRDGALTGKRPGGPLRMTR